MKKQCVTCKEWKQEEEFDWRWKSIGVKRDECKACEVEYMKAWWKAEKIRQIVRRLKRLNK